MTYVKLRNRLKTPVEDESQRLWQQARLFFKGIAISCRRKNSRRLPSTDLAFSPKGVFRRVLIAALGALCLTTALPGQSAHRQLRNGEKQYDKKNYLQAENAYRQASNDPAAVYNAGNAAYQQGKYGASVELYKKAAAIAASNPAKSDALYNLGNAYLQQGKLEEAITAYENSLRLRANRPDAKKNLQIAKNKLREQQEPPPPPPPQKTPPPPPPPRRNYVDRAQQPQQKELPSGTMTAEMARQLLGATIEQEEQKNARQYRALPPEARPARTKKDW